MDYSLRQYLDADWQRLGALNGQVTKRKFKSIFFPRFTPVVLIRLAHSLRIAGWTRLSKIFSFANFLIFGIEVPSTLRIGPGLVIPHSHGTVLGAASIGANVTIFHQVTLGARRADFAYTKELRPVIEDEVVLSVGAKVLGSVVVGRESVVGANAVVLIDVPPYSVAVGVPATFSMK